MKYSEHAQKTDADNYAGSSAHLEATATPKSLKGTQFTALALPDMILLYG